MSEEVTDFTVQGAEAAVQRAAERKSVMRPGDIVQLKYHKKWTGKVLEVGETQALVEQRYVNLTGLPPDGRVHTWVHLGLLELVPGKNEGEIAA